MSKINHQNIEQWLFDYTEGNLTLSQQHELQNFLRAHPEYSEDLAAWEDASVNSEVAEPYSRMQELHAIAAPSARLRYAFAAVITLLFMGGATVLYFNFYSGNAIVESTTNAEKNTAAENSFVASVSPSYSSLVYNYNKPGTSAGNETTSEYSSTAFINKTKNSVKSTLSANISNRFTWFARQRENRTNRQNNRADVNSIPEISNTNNNFSMIPYERNEPGKTTDFSRFNFAPEILLSEILNGEKAASTAFSVLKAQKNKNDNEIVFTPEQYAEHKRKNHAQKRKKFFDYELGTHNNRDHILLQPDNVNVTGYAAFAGSSVSPALNLNYRNQFTGSANRLSSYRMAYDQYFRNLGTALGFAGSYSDFANGMYTSASASVIVSPKVKLSKFVTFEPGITATYTQKSVDPSKAGSGQVIEPYRGFVTTAFENGTEQRPTTLGYFDMSMSALLNARKFYAAVGVDNIVSPAEDLYSDGKTNDIRVERKYKATLGTDFKQYHESKFTLSPQLNFMHQGQVTELWAGAIAHIEMSDIVASNKWGTYFGGAVSQNKQVLATAGIKTGILRFGYQFDITKSYSTQTYYSSHEATLRVSIGGLQRKQSAILDDPQLGGK